MQAYNYVHNSLYNCNMLLFPILIYNYADNKRSTEFVSANYNYLYYNRRQNLVQAALKKSVQTVMINSNSD